MTRKPCEAQKWTRGAYPSMEFPKPCEKIITGKSVPDTGAETLTCNGNGRYGDERVIGL